MKKIVFLFSFFLASFGNFAHAQEVKVIACQNSVEMIEYGLELIDQAQQSIEFSPCFLGGEVCQRYLTAIEKRMKLNKRLQVYVLLTPTLMDHEDKACLRRLQGIYPRQFHSIFTTTVVDISKDLSAVDNHVKMLVVDEYYFTMGGTNYDDSMCTDGSSPIPRHEKPGIVASQLPAGSRDQDVVGRSQLIARELRMTFHKLFALWTEYDKAKRFKSKDPNAYVDRWAFKEIDLYKRPYAKRFEQDERAIMIDSDQIQILLGGPSAGSNPITTKYCQLINEATQEITVGNLYFAPVDCLMGAFKEAANRGVKISIITNGIHDKAPSYNPMFVWANRICYLPIMYGRDFHFWEKSKCKKSPERNVLIYEYQIEDILYHKKVLVVDNRYTIIGSYNIGHRSDMSDYELIMVVDSPEFARAARRPIDHDVTLSQKVSSTQMQDWYFDPITAYKSEVQKKFHPLL